MEDTLKPAAEAVADSTIKDTWRVFRIMAEFVEGFETLGPISGRGVTVFGYANNHYAGHSPATLRSLLDLIEPSLRRERPQPVEPQGSLFEL